MNILFQANCCNPPDIMALYIPTWSSQNLRNFRYYSACTVFL